MKSQAKAYTKILSCLLASGILVTGISSNKVAAFNISSDQILSGAIGATVAGVAPNICYNIYHMISSFFKNIVRTYKDNKCKGFKSPQQIVNDLEKIMENKSNIKVHGQTKAKKQLFDVLSGAIARIDNIKRGNTDTKEIRGNIIYLIGPSGVGKTKMCYAIADAFLRHPEKTSIFCHSESITGESELGSQLFKTIIAKDIGQERTKNIFTGSDGLIPKDEESQMLKHLLRWYDSIVIIDEYDKMKQKSAKPGSTMNINGMTVPTGQAGSGEDKSADEILRSIASTGKYRFMNKEVDCSKVLFLITTNETREELEKNFGIGGTQGGGAQRLSIIEFDYLPKEACLAIVNDMIEEITKVLVNKNGIFKLNSIKFDKKSIEMMAEYIFNDKIMQGRAKYKLEDKIYSLLSTDLGKDYNKNIKLSIRYSEEDKDVYFIKETL